MPHDRLLLGQATEYPQRYSPEVLSPIARREGRVAVGIAEGDPLPFQGVDIWTHYEVSWLDAQGKPRVAVAEIRVPADSPCLIESKSMKLYFNSLNFERFENSEAFVRCVEKDLSAAAQAAVQMRLLMPEQYAEAALTRWPGECLDDLPLSCNEFVLNPDTLRADTSRIVEDTLYSDLLRSNCPVTHQPDWGSVLIHYRGPALDRTGLLAYLVSYRNHSDFHEQCVERIFMDILQRCRPESLTVYARYTRRGGLDINPFRSTGQNPPPWLRLYRQ